MLVRQVVVSLYNIHQKSEAEYKKLNTDTHKYDTLELDDEISDFKKSGVAPTSVWLQHAESAKEVYLGNAIHQVFELITIVCLLQALGPLALSLDLNREAMEKACTVGTSEANFRARKLEKEKQKITDSFRMAKTNLDEVRQHVAEQVGRTLVSDVRKYQNALDELTANEGEEYGQLEELAASIVNKGPIQAGQLAMVSHDERMQKAQVRSTGADGQVTVSIWQVLNFVGYRYEEGFYTSQAVFKTLPRQQVYALGGKDHQTLTASTVDAVVAACTDPDRLKGALQNPKRPEFMMALYADAAETRVRLIDLGNEVEERVNAPTDAVQAVLVDMSRVNKKVEAVVPSLKGIARATVKTKEKYGGCFSCLTDLARMTFICENVVNVIAVLKFIHGHAQWTIIRIKNRLHRQHDASATGGYRDMLLNVQDNTSGHIAEIQITFRRFFTIKSGGGHAVYKLARLLELNDEETTYFMGEIDKSIVEKIGAGLVDGYRRVSGDMSEYVVD